ncbi:MAG: DNA cytosine methyltransferase [Gammaproteobacteria bacterium]|nr:DNA cytosine methyltransferase [Gammaproteobacteria bacterium]
MKTHHRHEDFKTQYRLNFANEIRVDLFAGGGGASTGIEMGTGSPVDIAINHDPDAISLHTINHPGATHFVSDVYDVDPIEACGGRPVGSLHASPDCTHFSQAGGGQPRVRSIRSLSWVVIKWAGTVRPRVITLENVKQILQWGPLVAKRDQKTGRVIKLDRTVAAPGERVPISQQYLIPDNRHKGRTWKQFKGLLETMGYVVETRSIAACSLGAGTTRDRLYMVARCDGEPIVWPEPTHAKKPRRGQRKVRTAAESIDFSIPSQSIFDRKKPLAKNTMRRLAKGVKKYIIDAAEPFIVPGDVRAPFVSTYYGEKSDSDIRGSGMDEPIATQTTENRFALAEAVLAPYLTEHANGSNQRVMDADAPLGTITAGPKGGSFALATAYLAQMNGGFNENPGHDLREPVSSITSTGSQQQLVTANLIQLRKNCDARSVDEALPVICAGGEHHGLVTAFLSRQFGNSVGQGLEDPAPTITPGGGGKTALVELHLAPEVEAGALRCAAFLMQYYSEGGQWGDLNKPLGTITTKDRLALVTVWIKGSPYVIVDICLRMLQPRELFRAQGFPDSYIIDRGHDGRVFPKYKQVRFVGNSVSPLPMAAIYEANCRPPERYQRAA